MFMSKTVICVVYLDDFLLWARSQSDIDNVIKSFKEDGPSYNWKRSKIESVYEFLFIDVKTLDYGRFKFCQTGLICKFLGVTWMEHCNWLPTTTNIEAPLVTDVNVSESKRYWNNSYDSVIGMMLYLT